MGKFLITTLLFSSICFAGLINGIAAIINNEPVTLYDIDQKMIDSRVNKQQAFDLIVEETLYNQELKKNNISVDIFDIDEYISKLARQNNMNVLDFKAVVSQQQDYESFKKNIKKQLKHQKLVQKIASGKVKIVDDNDMKIFYQNNLSQFETASSFDVIAYVSKNKQLLEQMKQNPLMASDEVMVQNLTMKQEELNSQVKYILNTSNEKEFTAIFAQNQNYNMFFISSKNDVTTMSFDSVKNSIFQTMMKQREERFLKDFFETLKITADIKILRD